MNFSALLTIIATLFLLMACGFFARKKGIIDDVASKRLSTLIIKIGQPMMIVSALVEAEFPETSFSAGLLTALLDDPKEAQLAYELLKTLKEGK